MNLMNTDDLDAQNARNFSLWLKSQLREKGWSMTRLASEAGVSPQLISVYVGVKPDPKTLKPILPKSATVEKIAKALNVPLEDARRSVGLYESHPTPISAADLSGEVFGRKLQELIATFNTFSLPEKRRALKVLIITFGDPADVGDQALEISDPASFALPGSSHTDIKRRDFEEVGAKPVRK